MSRKESDPCSPGQRRDTGLNTDRVPNHRLPNRKSQEGDNHRTSPRPHSGKPLPDESQDVRRSRSDCSQSVPIGATKKSKRKCGSDGIGSPGLDQRHLIELRASGLTDETIRAAHILSADGEVVRKVLKWNSPPGCRGLVYPYPTADGKWKPFGRVKLDEPRTIDEKTLKYEAPRGLGNRAYFPPGFAGAFADNGPVLIAEGEKKALAAWQAGFTCIGLPGTWAWQRKRARKKNGDPVGMRTPISDLANLNWQNRRVFIVYDSDTLDKPEVRHGECELARALERLGAIVHVVRLPGNRDGQKVGLDDFLVLQGKDGPAELQRLLDTSLYWAVNAILEDGKPNSMDIAAAWLHDQFRHAEGWTLRYWRNEFWEWSGTMYSRVGKDDLHKLVLQWIKQYLANPTPRRASDVLECAASCVLVRDDQEQPTWLGKGGPEQHRDWVAMENGILDLAALIAGEADVLRPHSPFWFSPTALSYPYDPEAACPEWKRFLEDVFDGDVERIDLLAEWFGYCLTADTSQQAIMLLEGPRRSGKGTTLRVLRQLVGEENCVDPRLSTLDSMFGLWGLIGKSVAICSDVHLAGGSKALSVLETLKSISGEDAIEIHRKNLPSVSCRLGVRFILAVNELPQFGDASNALASRLLILPYRNSYVGKEDRDLERKLALEVQGILLWAIEGLRRLRAKSKFTMPVASEGVKEDFARLSSPIQAFIEDWCEVGSEHQVPVSELWTDWCHWCNQQGHHPGNQSRFGMRLRVAIPGLQKLRPGGGKGTRPYFYRGIRRKTDDGDSGGPSGPPDCLVQVGKVGKISTVTRV